MPIHIPRFLCAAILGGLALQPAAAWARIKLITLPVRERVEIQLDHANATLVEEERIVPLIKGDNQIDFSWANTQIDPNTILFRVLPRGTANGEPDDDRPKVQPPGDGGSQLAVHVLSVSYPPNENSLVWQVSASDSGSARVRISYLLGNLTKSFHYRAVASRDESTMVLSQYIRLQNLANEAFGSTGLWAGFGPRFLKPIGIAETKQMLMAKVDSVPIKKTYTCDVQAHGYLDQPKNKLLVPMHYVIQNSVSNKLGQSALQFGKARIFQEDGHGATAFIGEDWGQFTPIDDEMRLYVGVAQDIVVVRTIAKHEAKRVAGNLYNRDVIVKYEIENFKDRAVTLDIVENVRALHQELGLNQGRDVEWESGRETTFVGGIDKSKTTFDKAVAHADLPARGADTKAAKLVFQLHIVMKNEW